MTPLTLLLLVACSRPLAVVPGATRLAEMANGELLVGTSAGELVLLNTFGETHLLAHLDAAPVELVTDPLGGYHARLADGRVLSGGLWAAPVQVGSDAALLLRGCEETRWLGATSPEVAGGATALGLASCDRVWTGTATGAVDGTPVSNAALRHVATVGDGVLWVDAAGAAGCLGCDSPVPGSGVIDAIPLHVAPFLPGEFAWVDAGGAIWIDAD